MKSKTSLVFNLVILAICLINSCYSVDLDPYGPPIDNDLHCHACTSGNVIPQGSTITYFGEIYTEMYVSSNGIISLGCDAEDELSFQKVPMIAPYLSDIDTRLINNAVVDGSVFYRTEVGDDVEFDTWVLDHFGIPFLTSYEVIATWDHVKELDQSTSARNTFQVIVYSSAYGDTAVCFNYPSNGLNWPDASNPPHSIYPIAGFYSGSDLNIAYYLPGSGTPSVSNLDDLEGNFGEIGQFCYIVSSLEVISDCTYDFLTCRPPSFFPINTPLSYADVLSQYAHCNDQDLTIDTTSFNCNQLGDLVPVTAQIGSLSCISYFIPVVYNKLAYINCPSNIHLYSNEAITVNWQAPTITGDCQSGHEYVNYQPNYSLFPIGTTTVTYHTYDVNYNHVYCNFDVTIESYVTVIYHVIDILNRPINAAAIGGNPDCQYTDVYGICQVTSNNLLVGDFIPAGYFYVNFNGNIYSIPHGDIYINCLNIDITLIISPPGFYRSTNGDILPCAPGTYSTIYEASSCYPCSVGTYNNDYFQTSCENCPVGYYSSTGATECFSCYAGYYLDQYSGSCELCPAGSYSCDRSIQCELCPYGSYSSAGSAECSYCSSGYYLDQYSNHCTICPANTYSSDRATICTPCPTGYYSPPGSTYCSACNAGYYLDLSSYQCLACPSGFYSCDRAISCDACPTGGYSTPGSASCTFCTAGYFRDLDDTCDSPPCGCSPCPAGSYSCDRADVCEVCPPGSWSMPGSATCFSCSAGYYLDTQTGSCVACEANTYSLDRALYCSDCPDGSYSSGGSSECTFCIGGYYYNNYTGSCETCPAGTYSHARATSCTPCPTGGYSFDGSTECSYCTSGYYLNQYTMNCQACESGTYSCDRSIECTQCPEGSYSSIGSSNCSYCIAGYYYDQFSDSCLPCSPGTFSADRASSCINCPIGYYSQAGSSSCYSCTAGYYLDLSTGQCTACPIGFTSYDRAISCYLIPVTPPVNEVITCSIGYYIELATNSCIPCPPNTFSTTDRSTQCIPCPYGSYSNMASSTCTFCNAGYYFDVSSSTCYPCPANYFSPDRATQCFPCPFNSYSSIASSYCTACPNGTYLDQSGSCRLCDSHSFYYNGVCIPCDLSFSSDYCPFCPPGYESNVVCNECCEGFYSPDGNTCLPCPDGAYSGPGYSQCVYCPEGYMWDDDRHICYPCDK